jgi:hypothetical protein
MTVIVPGQSGRSKVERMQPAPLRTASADAWKLLGSLGAAFLFMSSIDLALGWIPLKFGTPEWEFGTLSATFAGLAIPTLALYLMLGSAIARERFHIIKTLAWAMAALALVLAFLCLVYLTSVPLALRAVANNEIVSTGLKKSVIKSLMLFIGYEILYVLGAIQGLRRRPVA